MATTATSKRGMKRARKSTWVGRGAKRFSNRKNWLRLYAGMGTASFLLTLPVFAPLLLDSPDVSSLLLILILLFLQQAIEFAFALAIAFSYNVWVGENGIEARIFGAATERFTWNKVARVELYQILGMRCVRVFQPGKRFPVYLPVYFDQTDAVFREVGDWLGYGTNTFLAETQTETAVASTNPATTTLTGTVSEATVLVQHRHT